MGIFRDFIPDGEALDGQGGKGGFQDYVPDPVPTYHPIEEEKEEEPKKKVSK